MSERSRTYACHNRACTQYQMRATVWGQLCSVRFYSWPILTCTGCGQVPRIVTDKPVAVDAPVKPVRKVSTR